ncbi:protein UXT [Trypanosoma rangeli]|uniref:Protein UXT n=1 Tax=Trypanosoma rangeli TaxID=5698 RepID=A0A422N2I2_TRYRA|nr:protein UXT [Trypanosoma rangeli]RNE99660.1 protein UXT [Trypanosoma rangeli]|eukprot:RNE99660.1 protein UXT [Trypanosoma rangeli]
MFAETGGHAPPTSFDAETGSMARLEHFLDAVLRQSLEKVLRERDTVYTMVSDCCQLRKLFEEMRALSSTHSFISEGEASSPSVAAAAAAAAAAECGEEGKPQRNQIMVDIGNHFFVQCSVRDASQVWVNLGCGVVLSMSTAEADAFMQKKERLLRERAARLSKEALRIKYRIRLVMEAIARLYDRATGQRA